MYVTIHKALVRKLHAIENMHGLKIDTNFFLKMLNGEWLVKHKSFEDKEVIKISGHQGLSIQEG